MRSGPDENAVTIWIGVLPDSTNGNTAFHVSEEILTLLKERGIDDIGIAFRESVTRPYAKSATSGPILYAPVWSHIEPLSEVIEWVTTALSLPIASLDSPRIEGTLGFYFKVGEDLYGVTTRHALFPATDGNDYTYDPSTSMEKKSVILMGTEAFKNLVSAVEFNIDRLSRDFPAEAGSTGFHKQDQLDKKKQKLAELKKYLETLESDWSDIHDRVIGHVVWSPPISGFNAGAPRSYMRDVCVIELDKTKFLPNLLGNVMDLGGIIATSELTSFLYPPSDEFPRGDDVPLFCFYPLRNILPVSEIKEPNIQGNHSSGHNSTRFVFKRGFRRSPETTIGALNGFLSRTRRYTPSGTVEVDSIDTAVFPSYGVRFYPFSELGDSGSAIVGTHNEFVFQLTSGAGSAQADFCDITYGTPMEWLWEDVIKPKFPDAVLFFDTPLAEDFVLKG